MLRAAVWRNGSADDLVIRTEDLIAAAQAYRPQFEMQNASKNREEPLPTLDAALQQMVYDSMEAVTGDWSFSTHSDNTDYDEVYARADSAIENRIDGATLVDNDGDQTGNLYTR